MKKSITPFLLGISVALLFAFTPKSMNDSKGMALVDQEQGLYILFVQSLPVTTSS